MTVYIIRRLLSTIPVLVLMSMIIFGITHLLPGDPALALLGENMAKDEAAYQAAREQMKLNQPVPLQYLAWASRVMTGDWGDSIRNKQPVTEALMKRLAPTVQLTMMALIIAVIVGLPSGLISALKPSSGFDIATTFGALAGVAFPPFWLGILLVLVFALWLRWLPPSGYVSPFDDFGASMKLMIMPAIALSTSLTAAIAQQIRSSLIEVMNEDYIRTARAKGLREATIFARHALKNSLIPTVTVIGLSVGRLLGGTVTVELIFGIPGMGRVAADSIFFRDFPMIQGVILFMAAAVLLSSIVTDICYAYIDPRIRYGS